MNITNDLKPSIISQKSSILDVSQGSVHASSEVTSSTCQTFYMFYLYSSEFTVTHFEGIAVYLMSFFHA